MTRVVVAGNWEIGYNTPIIEATYWNLVLRDFSVTEWLMSPVSGITHNEHQTVILNEFPDYQSMLDSVKELPRVFLEPRTDHQNPNTVWLEDFIHPGSCVYVLGSAHYNPTITNCRENDSVVSIRTINNKGVLWSHQCVPIVLYDRMIKHGRSSN